MATEIITVIQRIEQDRQARSSGIMPDFVYSAFGALNSTCRAVENLAGILEQGTHDLAGIAEDVLRDQRETMRLNHAATVARAQKLATA